MRELFVLAVSVLLSATVAAQEGPKVTGDKADLACDTSTFCFQVQTEGIADITIDRIRSRTGIALRKAGMHPVYVNEYPQMLLQLRTDGKTYRASVDWIKEEFAEPVWSATQTGEGDSPPEMDRAVEGLVKLFLKDFLETNAGLLQK